MCEDREYEICSECGKEFPKEKGRGVSMGYPVCDLCPLIEDLEMEIDDIAFDISYSDPGLERQALFGSLVALQMRLSELKLEQGRRL